MDSTDRTTPSAAALPATMAAVTATEYGTAEVLRTGQLAVPTIGDDEVLVRVAAAGLDRGTWHLMTGMPYLTRLIGVGVRAPKNPVPGLDVAGTVVAVGATVTRFAVGDEVFGISRGSFAQYAAAREDKLARKPAALTFEQAAVLGVSGLTALGAVVDSGRVAAGQRVLVLGASGGVGSYAVQIAKAAGAHVTGVCSAAKADLVRGLGADDVLDYARDDFADGSATYDLIVDTGGRSSLSKLRRALTPSGTAAIVGGEGGGKITGGFDRQLRAAMLSPVIRQRLVPVMAKEHYEGLERLAAMVDDGSLVPAVDATFPLVEAASAMRRLEAGEVRGKVAISVA
jgi:NADPH:quinone reductase-like Zn-dependent oxidoreductase